MATTFQIMGHAEVVAHLMGHGGSHANGILRVVLVRERVQVRKTAHDPKPAFLLATPGSLIKTCAFNYRLHCQS